MISFGKRLEKLRKEKGLNKVELGKLIGVSSGQVNNYERDTSDPTLKVLQKIRDVFNVSWEYLLDEPSDEFGKQIEHDFKRLNKLNQLQKYCIARLIDNFHTANGIDQIHKDSNRSTIESYLDQDTLILLAKSAS